MLKYVRTYKHYVSAIEINQKLTYYIVANSHNDIYFMMISTYFINGHNSKYSWFKNNFIDIFLFIYGYWL